MSIDAGDRWVEYEIKERERVGRYMYEHQFDYVKRDEYNRVSDRLDEAKEIIKNLIRVTYGEGWNYSLDWKVKAESFIKEVEK